jgi:hypothetical protein
VKSKHSKALMVVLLFSSALALQAGCSPQEERMAQSADPTTTPGTTADPFSETRHIRLTGCVERGTGAGEYLLTGVATAGVVDAPEEAQQDERSWTADPATSPEAAARLKAGSTYRLLVSGLDEDLSEYVGNRVTVGGRLAAEVPERGTGGLAAEGETVESHREGTTVLGTAPQARGFHADSINRVSDTCAR